MASISVLVVDSQALFRESLCAMLADQDSFVVVGAAGDMATAARLAAALHPDVVVMDLLSFDCQNSDAIGRIVAAKGDNRIIALTALEDESSLAAALAAGAQGYVLKNRPVGELLHAIRIVAQGGVALDATSTSVVWQRFQQLARHQRPAEPETLSSSEREVLSLLAAGKRTHQIAETLASSPAVIEKIVADLCVKLHARNRTEATVIALKQGLIQAH
jgi:DNA-binding NarL/FixJ family response regulator